MFLIYIVVSAVIIIGMVALIYSIDWKESVSEPVVDKAEVARRQESERLAALAHSLMSSPDEIAAKSRAISQKESQQRQESRQRYTDSLRQRKRL